MNEINAETDYPPDSGSVRPQSGAGGLSNLPDVIRMADNILFYRHASLGVDPDAAFTELRDTIPWKAREIKIAGRCVMQPRLTSWHADEGVTYTYSGRTHNPKQWTPTLLAIRDSVERIAKARFNSVLLNRYPNERASIGYHSDDEPELGERPTIASVSLGAEREFRFRPKSFDSAPLRVGLTHGSVLVMRGDTQKHWMHGIEKSRVPCGERINLTFRLTNPR
jgi:alkylated DNA repair dioxygenase AlkB